MNDIALFNKSAFRCSKEVTKLYSTSFSLGIRTMGKQYRDPIYALYGFSRYADEIVDTFHDKPKARLLEQFKQETYQAIELGISMNPILHAFQDVVNTYNIDRALIDQFLYSMEMDLEYDRYEDKAMYDHYIYGSAQVVGLMCLYVFVGGDKVKYEQLKEGACALGAAFQKVNFLRDLKADYLERGRVYFPGVNFTEFDNEAKKAIEADIQADFDAAHEAILQLPDGARRGVYLAYVYYTKLFDRIKRSNADLVKQERIRVPDGRKIGLLLSTMVKGRLNLL